MVPAVIVCAVVVVVVVMDQSWLLDDEQSHDYATGKFTHRQKVQVHVFNSAKNNTYFINFSREIGQPKSVNLNENFRMTNHTRIETEIDLFGK